MNTIRVYKFRCLKYGLQSLNQQRLKVATLTDLNDPFELCAVDLREKGFRKNHKTELKKLSKIRGFVSFSKDWSNPVLWAHYADSQKGLCIGFDVPEEHIFEMQYLNERVKRETIAEKLAKTDVTTNDVRELFAKSTHWAYEEEFRIWYDLNTLKHEKESGLYFSTFSENLKPVEVIVGPACDVESNVIEKALARCKHSISIRQARPAFKSFDIIEDRRGFIGTKKATN